MYILYNLNVILKLYFLIKLKNYANLQGRSTFLEGEVLLVNRTSIKNWIGL